MSESTTTEHDDDLDPEAPVTVADKEREPTPYERKLRAESAKSRRLLREAQKDRDEKLAMSQREREEAVVAAQRERDEKIAEVRREADQRLLRAELKAAAIKAGMVDTDGLKLLDLSAVKLGENGEAVLPEGFFESAKQAKPFLFGTVQTSTSSTATPPPAEQPKPKKATEWTPEEMAAASRRLAEGKPLVG